MSSKLTLLIAFALPLGAIASENNNEQRNKERKPLEVTPSKCVALNEGRTCFADVTFTMSLPDEQEYCLREKDQALPIGCWKDVSTVNYLYSFARKTSATFELISRKDAKVIGEGTIDVNWVHKIRTKKRRWRLF
ncbi:hypothetical protein PALB_34760 [Pseudoalteromonas luteoviolacea B = ATCC 29581]|nr:hypothetical protein PALB_34760 [Pseudoalteromonas luteoviolacea B = ATCC 29581]